MAMSEILSRFQGIVDNDNDNDNNKYEGKATHQCRLLSAWMGKDGGCDVRAFTTYLGYCLIVMMAFAHMPLLFDTLKSRNRKIHHSPVSIVLLVITSSNYVSYAVYKHLPISTWGEGIVQLSLYVIISNLMLLHQGRHKEAVTFTFVYVIAMMVILMPLVPGYMVVWLKLLNLSINLARNVLYVYKFHKEGCFTEVPVFSSIFFLNVCSYGRLLTATVNTHDLLFVACYCQDCVFNGVLTLQAIRLSRRKRKLSLAARGSEKKG